MERERNVALPRQTATQFGQRGLALALGVAAALAAAGGATGSEAASLKALHGKSAAVRTCTMAVPAIAATVEAEIANAGDFCELVSHGLADDVFHAPVLVTPGVLWHYADATLSCRLRYRNTSHRVTIRNSRAACRWLGRVATGWRRDTLPLS